MLLVATLALAAAPVDIPELARRGAPIVATCTSPAPIQRLVTGGPLEALIGRAGTLEGPMSLAMWDKEHMEIRMSGAGAQLGLPGRDEGGQHVYGEGVIGAEPIIVNKSLAVVLQTQPGCSVWADVGRMPGQTQEVKAEGQFTLMLPEQPGPAQFAMVSPEWIGKPTPSKHLELDLQVSSAPFALIVSDSRVETRPKDPKRRKQARQLKAVFPMDGFVGGLWLPEHGNTITFAGSVSLSKNLSAKAISTRIGIALERGKIPFTREGDLLHFRVGDVPELQQALASSPEAGGAATGFINTLELWVQPMDGHFRVGTTREALAIFSAGAPLVPADVRARLDKDDFVMTLQPVDAISSTDKPVMMTMRMTEGMAFGTFDVPEGYLDWEKLGQMFGGDLKR